MSHFSHQTRWSASRRVVGLGAPRWAAQPAGYALALMIACGTSAEAQSAHVKAAASRPGTSKAAATAPIKGSPPIVKSPEKPVTITVRPNCEVGGPVFTLGEIADLQGDD